MGLSREVLRKVLKQPWRDRLCALVPPGGKRALAVSGDGVAAMLRESTSATSANTVSGTLTRMARWGFRLPCSVEDVLRLLHHARAVRHYKPSSLDPLLWAVSRFHQLLELPNPVGHVLVAAAKKGFDALYKSELVESSAAGAGVSTGTVGGVRGRSRVDALDWRVPMELLRRGARQEASVESAELMVLTGFFLGLRPGSLVALRARDVEVGKQLVQIRIATEKTERRTPVPPRKVTFHGDWEQSAWMNRLVRLARQRLRVGGEDAFLFHDQQASSRRPTGLVTQAVRRVVEDLRVSVGLVLDPKAVAGASLRPGCASALRLLAYSVSQVCFHCNWRDAKMLYRYDRPEAGVVVPDDRVAREFKFMLGKPQLSG